MKTAIAYFSSHHGNTKKLVDAIAAANEVDLIDVTAVKTVDLTGYDRIGLASGVYAGSFGKPLIRFAEENLPAGKNVFLLYTYAAKMGHYTNAIRAVLSQKSCPVIGEYGCTGFNTFGPFKLVGGTGKGHPTEEELAAAAAFYRAL